MFDQSVFKPLYMALGFWRSAVVKPKTGAAFTLWFGWREPHTLRLETMNSATRSVDYEIEYVHADAPKLGEGDVFTMNDAAGAPLPKEKFRVRASPFVSEDDEQRHRSTDGYWRRAQLTRI